ncbi:recombination factor protein RarA, partial [Pseudomonas aeruginosa]|nr:recombination factor protein RarA [Pseudomonas aeruginosa]
MPRPPRPPAIGPAGPANLDEYVGQEHLLARGKPLREALEQGALHSMIFWGPPGVGK